MINVMDERSVDDQTVNVDDDDLLTGDDAVKLLPGVTYQTLMRWARQGHVTSVQYVKRGRRLFPRSAIEELKRHRSTNAEQSAPSASPPPSPDGVLPGQPVLSWPSPASPATVVSAS
ncbi:helix-turn-helix domain-containing protein [Actinomyces sp.]|uniref:helix-turn-helix domain-containing protein n=1 Tax=Actinomyces sp. TaxID=29317 RepID=UPI0026DCC764|nr:helix-turn-helix domain-containing protein [Actinomyces sp.]MDO4900949.1 helix-turn-helix domain-containing protein [Actinomyces sp.]